MNVALVNPVTINGVRILRTERCQQKIVPGVGNWPPINLLEIAKELKSRQGCAVRIFDGEGERADFSGLIKRITDHGPQLAVIQSTIPTVNDDIFFADVLSERLPEVEIAFTGLSATVIPEFVLDAKSVDYVAMGEPEDTICDLVAARLEKVNDLSHIAGLGFKLGDKVSINQRRPHKKSYDYKSFPDLSLIDGGRYLLSLTGKRFTVIKTSRGCDFSCAFCTSRAYYGAGWKARSPENIIEEIKQARCDHGIEDFMFLSDTFNGNREFLKELCLGITRLGFKIRWVVNSRLDLIDEGAVHLMKEAGCILVSLGIESYDQEVLDANRKSMKRESIDSGISLFNKYGILTYGYFIFGLKGDTRTKILSTALKAFSSKLDFAMFYTLTPYPGTEYFDRRAKAKWRDYFHGISNIVSYRHLSRLEIRLYVYLATFLFYTRPKRIILLARYLLLGRIL